MKNDYIFVAINLNTFSQLRSTDSKCPSVQITFTNDINVLYLAANMLEQDTTDRFDTEELALYLKKRFVHCGRECRSGKSAFPWELCGRSGVRIWTDF